MLGLQGIQRFRVWGLCFVVWGLCFVLESRVEEAEV